MPGMGVARFDVRPNLRMFPVGNYLILYQEIEAVSYTHLDVYKRQLQQSPQWP